MNISQSLIKAYYDVHHKKECGLFFKANYIDKDPEAQRVPSDSMKVGIYFEYLCTGALPKDGKIPEPEMAYKGTAREKLSAPYERVIESAKVFKTIIEHYNIEILDKGLFLEDKDLGINGVIDIYAKWDGKPVFIDLKYSGLIDDKWNEMGWDIDSLPMKDSIMVQGVHYKLLAERALGIEDIPFYYFVFSSSDPNNVKIIKQNIDESRKQSHIVTIVDTRKWIDYRLKTGFEALPSLNRCFNCPINHKCPSKVDYPLVDEVYY